MISEREHYATNMPEKVLFDVNVILDVIENRAPHVLHSGPALKQAEDGHIIGYVSASSIDTLAFLLRRTVSSIVTHNILQDILSILQVATVDDHVIRMALNAKWDDPEDAILYVAAIHAGCTKIVTRNKRDFRLADTTMTIALPSELMI
jgi:predicted nucleic acid-binding protein